MQKEKYCVNGMHCKSCEIYIESQLKDVKGISNVKSDSTKQILTFEKEKGLDIENIINKINKEISRKGYTISKEKIEEKKSLDNIPLAFLIALLLMILFWGIQKVGIGGNLFSSELSLSLVFLLGVVASVSTCMAVVGALVLSFSSIIAKGSNFKTSVILFHISRLVSFFVLGGILGVLGSLILLTPDMQMLLSIFLFVVMVILALDMLDIYPIFNRLKFTLPKSISQNMLNRKAIGSIFTPILFGIVSFFLPCGFTQSMQIQSVLTSSFFEGALTMFVFALGTLPVLLLISVSSKFLTKGKEKDLFFKVSGFLVLLFAIYNLYGTLVANGIIQPII